MAFVVKNVNSQRSAAVTGSGQAILNQMIRVNRPALVLPQSTTEQLFLVRNGRVWVRGLIGTATVVLTATDPQLSVNSSALNAAMDTIVGTTIVMASTVSLASLEVGGMAMVEGDGTAVVKYTAGGITAFNGAMATTSGGFMAPRGEIYITTAANNTTGQMTWDLWYQPLDQGAYVEAVSVATAAI